jgi:hypothetical protein
MVMVIACHDKILVHRRLRIVIIAVWIDIGWELALQQGWQHNFLRHQSRFILLQLQMLILELRQFQSRRHHFLTFFLHWHHFLLKDSMQRILNTRQLLFTRCFLRCLISHRSLLKSEIRGVRLRLQNWRSYKHWILRNSLNSLLH